MRGIGQLTMLALILKFWSNDCNFFYMILRFLFIVFVFISSLQIFAQNSFKDDILFLTSDKLRGRGAGTLGDSIAQQYIINKYSKFNLIPFIDSNSYKQEFGICIGMNLKLL